MQHGLLDTKFHQFIYDRHYNRHAADLWWKHREILRAISRRFPTSLSRRNSVLNEHRELIAAIRAQDADRAAAVVAAHVQGSGRHIIEQMGVANRNSEGWRSPRK
jgi:DNA-binding GntR family transcriptional regulator